MHSKILKPLSHNRITVAQKFPQLRLLPERHKRITHHLQCLLPFSNLHSDTVEFAKRELAPGSIVEVRQDDRKLLALGFFEPEMERVDVFDVTPKYAAMLPTISEDFFMARAYEAWERRRRILPQTQNNTYRIINGYADGLPSLYVDIFSECFARVIATTRGAERLLPPLVEFLRRRGTEDILIDSPTLGDKERLTLVTPTIPLPQMYVESGVSHLWLKSDMQFRTTENLLLVNPAHRRTRRMIRELGKGKRVLTIFDRSGSASMNAVMTANHVTVVHQDEASLEWARANLVCNHSSAVFKTCETVCCDPLQLQLRRQQDVVYMECHPTLLATREQWKTLFETLTKNKIIGVGTVIIIAQEEAPMGARDLLERRGKEGLQAPIRRIPMAELLRGTMESCDLRIKFLRAFAVACDHPLLPEDWSASFSQVFLVEGQALDEDYR